VKSVLSVRPSVRLRYDEEIATCLYETTICIEPYEVKISELLLTLMPAESMAEYVK